MKSSKAVVAPRRPAQSRIRFSNYILLPQTLRDAIPGPELPGCARSLILSSIDGDCANDNFFGRRVRLKFRAEESGKLKGKFDIGVDLEVEAARALATTLMQLAERAAALHSKSTR